MGRDYFTGIQQELKRSSIRLADYNPRKISQQARTALRRSIRKYGVVTGIVVNKATMTIVGGNQKISILDEMLGYPNNDYSLRADIVDIPDINEEKSLCVMLNSPNAMGEWDEERMRELIPDINCEDAGLTEEDISFFGIDNSFNSDESQQLSDELDAMMHDAKQTLRHVPQTKDEQLKTKHIINCNQADAYATQEAQYQARKEQSPQADRIKPLEKAMDAEAYVMVSFDNMASKELFLKTFGFGETEKFIKGETLMKMVGEKQ